ncbi:MAG TPA: MarR family transcriptional regulator [Vicinamibacterales bacterium]
MARLSGTDYAALAEFRYQIRRFLQFSDTAARAHGIEGQQHQLLLALKGLPRGVKPTVGALAERLQLRHHSTVELLDRLADRGLVTRSPDPEDRRQVLIRITRRGDALLEKLTHVHRAELHTAGPRLLEALQSLLS